MSNKTVNTNMLEPGTIIMVRGNLTFSRTTRFLEGEALKQDIERNRSRGIPPTERPYIRATVCNAQVVRTDPNAPETNADIYARESMYASKTNPGYSFSAKKTAPTQKGNSYAIDWSKNVHTCWLGVMQPDGKTVTQIEQTGELDNGLDVTLVMRVFKSGNGMNNGVSLDGIILHEPVRYFNGNSSKALEERGIVMQSLPDDVTAIHPQSGTQAAVEQPQAVPQVPTAPAAGTEFTNNPANQQPQADTPFPMNPPVQQAQPQTASQGNAQAAPQPNNSAFNPQPANPNPSGFQGSESQGIRYNPGEMGRDY